MVFKFIFVISDMKELITKIASYSSFGAGLISAGRSIGTALRHTSEY
jgi:hypothetical protein